MASEWRGENERGRGVKMRRSKGVGVEERGGRGIKTRGRKEGRESEARS